jgi:hypothetical protein
MTLIGAIPTIEGVVLLADRQETIIDYAKFEAEKIRHHSSDGKLRIFMAGAGDSDTLDMIWEQALGEVIKKPNYANLPRSEIKAIIVRNIQSVTKKCIIPYPRNDRDWVQTIVAIQSSGTKGIELFRTSALTVNTVQKPFFTGSPILLMRYLSDLYLKNIMIGVAEAEALAAYMLLEAKEYDPNCGKQSDIFVLHNDGRLTIPQLANIRYWEDHFVLYKELLKLLPTISCSHGLTKDVYRKDEHLKSFAEAIKFLTAEQEKMRSAGNKAEKDSLRHRLTTHLSGHAPIPPVARSETKVFRGRIAKRNPKQ